MSITYLLPFIKNNIIYDAKVLIGSEVIKSAYHLREKFAKIFRKRYGLVFRTEKRNGIGLYHLQNTVFHFFRRGSIAHW